MFCGTEYAALMYTWESSQVLSTCTLSDTGRSDTPPTGTPFSLIRRDVCFTLGGEVRLGFEGDLKGDAGHRAAGVDAVRLVGGVEFQAGHSGGLALNEIDGDAVQHVGESGRARNRREVGVDTGLDAVHMEDDELPRRDVQRRGWNAIASSGQNDRVASGGRRLRAAEPRSQQGKHAPNDIHIRRLLYHFIE